MNISNLQVSLPAMLALFQVHDDNTMSWLPVRIAIFSKLLKHLLLPVCCNCCQYQNHFAIVSLRLTSSFVAEWNTFASSSSCTSTFHVHRNRICPIFSHHAVGTEMYPVPKRTHFGRQKMCCLQLGPLVTFFLRKLRVCPSLDAGLRFCFYIWTLGRFQWKHRQFVFRRDIITAWFCAFGCSPRMPRKHAAPLRYGSSFGKPLAARPDGDTITAHSISLTISTHRTMWIENWCVWGWPMKHSHWLIGSVPSLVDTWT